MNKVLIVIPTLNPPQELFKKYIDDLIKEGFDSILIVNDGSKVEFKPLFDELATKKECTVYNHAVNLGKGRALKNSINYFLTLPNVQDYIGIITADSDGQHEIKDVIKVRDAMVANPTKLYFGSRNFDGEDIPAKSRFGNKMTTNLVKLLYGKKIRDTQTGLRGIPAPIASLFIDLNGERFQYEMNMLVSAVRSNIDVEEIEIKTLYFDDNSETHFRPIQDSLEIMGTLLGTFFKYIMSSVSSFAVDLLLFQLMIILFRQLDNDLRIVISTVIARIGSSIINYLINKNIVFENKEKDSSLLIKYFSLVVVQMSISALLVALFYRVTGMQETLIKVLVDSFLFLVSYRIQKLYVFKSSIKQ